MKAATISNTPKQQITEAFDLQKANVYPLSQTTAAERVIKLKRVVTYIQQNQEQIAEAMRQDIGRASLDTIAELLMIKTEAEFISKHLKKWMKPQAVKTNLLSQGTKPYLWYEAKGVTLIIAPWNAPFACCLVPMIGAIAAGNAVIVKPSEMAPASSAVLKEMLAELFPTKEVAVFEGDAETGAHLLTLPFDHIYFTGSPRLGKIVMAAAAQNLTPVTLELGGKNPTVVDETALIDATAAKIAWGKCANSGQVCVAPDYILAHQSIKNELVEALKSKLTKMYDPDGKGIDQNEGYCRIINQNHFDRIVHLLEDAVLKGAKIEYGGKHNRNSLYIAPTILSNVNRDMLVMQEEIFGPLLPIKTYSTQEEATAYIRAGEKPLAMYIFSQKKANQQYFLKHTSAGSTVINHNLIQAGVNPYLPFGGVGNSGSGRSVGKASFLGFSNQRSVVEQPTGWKDFSTISLPPYTNMYQKMIRYLFAR